MDKRQREVLDAIRSAGLRVVSQSRFGKHWKYRVTDGTTERMVTVSSSPSDGSWLRSLNRTLRSREGS